MIKQGNKSRLYHICLSIYILFSTAMSGNGIEDNDINSSDLEDWLFYQRFPELTVLPPGKPDAKGGTSRKISPRFCYNKPDCAPTTWGGICSSGKHQSPIDLITKDAKIKTEVPLAFDKNYNETQKSYFVANNGHTYIIQLEKGGSSRYRFRHADLGFEYKFSQFHFHWAQKGTDGSEHTVDGERFPLELHLVHHKKTFVKFRDALESPDPSAVAVLGVFLKIGSHNKGLESIIKVSRYTRSGRPSQLYFCDEGIQLYSLLPENKTMFRYYGSLTTPNCAEFVLWTVFTTPVEISAEQADELRQIHLDHEDVLMGSQNFRPAQPLNGRKVELFLDC